MNSVSPEMFLLSCGIYASHPNWANEHNVARYKRLRGEYLSNTAHEMGWSVVGPPSYTYKLNGRGYSETSHHKPIPVVIDRESRDASSAARVM